MAPPETPALAPPPKRAVAFVRLTGGLSAGEQEDALKQHNLAFRRLCERMSFEPIETYVDAPPVEVLEAAIPTESAYGRLRQALSKGPPVMAVVMQRVDTLSDDDDQRDLRLLEIESLGAKVYLLNGQAVDSGSVLAGTWPQPSKTPADPGTRIKAAMRTRAMRGEGLGKPPYGYKIGPRRKLEVVPEEAENVKLIYNLYAQKGLGIRLIVRYLNEHKIVTRKGRNWSMVTIRDILRNRAYLGTYTRFGMRVPGSHAAIITPEVFRWTQAKLEERQPSRKEVQAEPFLLSSLIYCGSCGNRMMGVTRRQSWTRQRDGSRTEKEYRYYQCQSRTNQGVCNYHTRNAKDLEAKVLQFLLEERERLAALKGRRATGPSLAGLQRERKRLQAAEDKLAAKLKRSIKQVRAGKLSLLRFRPMSTELLQSRREMLDRLDLLNGVDGHTPPPLTPTQAAVATIDELAANWETLDFERKRELLASVVERIGVREEDLEITLRPELQA